MNRLEGQHVRPSYFRREFGLLLLIVAVTAIVSIGDAGFLSPINLKDILVRSAPTAIVCCGVMLVVATGEIDISVGSLMALLATVLGRMVSEDHAALPWPMGAVAVLVLGTAIGTATGLLVTLGRVPSIIVTLGLLTGLRGASTLMMQGQNIDGLPSELSELAKRGIGGMPISVWTAAIVISLNAILITHTSFGRRIFAIGSSRYAARMTGLPTRRLKLLAFAYTGFLTALATIVDVPRLPMIESGIGREFELLVVTCVVVGGVSISGGRGTLPGVLLAVILLQMIRPVLTFLAIGDAGEKWAKAIQGAFIMLAVVADSWSANRAARQGESNDQGE